ncbi:MAG: hypothetical protein AAF908_07110 [Pseudomonadota bacterium]
MTRLQTSAAFLALGLGLLPPTHADARAALCGKREQIVKQLEGRYGEAPTAIGLADGAGVMEIYANPTSGSWTIVITNPQGLTCLMAAGQAFERMEIAPGDSPA